MFAGFKINSKDLAPDQFTAWRNFFNELMALCLEVAKVCSNLLSNNRLDVDEDSEINVSVDCRGHPINKNKDSQIEEDAFADYDNLILVGVWLAVKENGLTLYNLLRWLELPSDEKDDTKFLHEKDIRNIAESLLTMLFEFKHRGAVEKAAETFSLLSNKLLSSNLAKHQKLP